MQQQNNLISSKPHYKILDGLRGIAAVIVVLFHLFEVHSNGIHANLWINHGYLAVDFFFMLSGFVLAYAYDDRVKTMSIRNFFKRRLIRLQPMIIIGSIIGASLFYFQQSPGLGWGGISDVPVWKLILVMVIGFTLIPVTKGLDIRGWREMHPLNGPGWSLFFEYIANIAFILIFIRLSKKWLTAIVIISAGITIHYVLTNPHGDIIGGWTVDDLEQMRIGFTRLLFPFTVGLLIARTAKLKHIKNAYLITGLLLIGFMAMPRFSTEYDLWNRLYECFCLMAVFPLIIWLGAGGNVKGSKSAKFCNFMGDISYPLYITHFPIAYLYMAYVTNNDLTFPESWPWLVTAFVIALGVAYISMKYFDTPVREWLNARFIKGDISKKVKIAPKAILQYVIRRR